MLQNGVPSRFGKPHPRQKGTFTSYLTELRKKTKYLGLECPLLKVKPLEQTGKERCLLHKVCGLNDIVSEFKND